MPIKHAFERGVALNFPLGQGDMTSVYPKENMSGGLNQ